MPRRSILSAAERESLLALPENRDDLIRRYTLSPSDISVIRQRRRVQSLLVPSLGTHSRMTTESCQDCAG